MADVVLLFVAALFVLGAAVTVAAVVRSGRRKALRARRDAPRRLLADLRDTDDYIRKVNEALSEDDLGSLEKESREP